jgi:hypothetical protein
MTMKTMFAGCMAAGVAAMLCVGQTQAEPPLKQPKYAKSLMAFDHNAAVVKFAVDNEGKRIGRGECTDLVNAALEKAGCKQIQIEKPTAAQKKLGYPDEIYVWGRRIAALRGTKLAYMPGDILQFENCVFKKPDGTRTLTMPHHTAIVKSAKGTEVTLLNQNAPIGGPVVEVTFDLAWIQSNTDGKKSFIFHYSPQPK